MNWLAIIFSAVIVYSVVSDLSRFKETISFSIRIWKMTRVHTIVLAIIGIVSIILTILFLDSKFPFMSKISWIYLFSGDAYNVGITAPAHIGVSKDNILYKLSYGSLLIGMFLLLPHWAFLEEKLFRQGRANWKQVPLTSLIFGLFHMIVGVPLTAGLALAIPGAIFHAYYIITYKRFLKNPKIDKHLDGFEMKADSLAEVIATLKATSLHTIYNSFLIIILFLVTVLWRKGRKTFKQVEIPAFFILLNPPT